MTKLYMGIDQSYTHTGWCVLNEQASIIDCGVISSTKTDDIFKRANQITTSLGYLVQQYVPKIAIEGLAFGAMGNNTRNLAGLQFVIVCHLQTLRYDVDIISPLTIKKHALQVLKKSNPDMKMKDTKKPQMYQALPQQTKDELEPYKFLKTKGLYDVVDGWWLANTMINEEKASNG